MASAMAEVCSTLGIDRADTNDGLILIEECHGSDSTFLLSAILSRAMKKSQGICLVLYHHGFSHYHNIGMKVGYNLMNAKQKGQIALVEPMKNILDCIENLTSDPEKNTLIFDRHTSDFQNSSTNFTYEHFRLIKDKYFELKKSHESVIIIVDGLSHLFDLGATLKDTMCYIRYLRSLAEQESKIELCLVLHTCRESRDSLTNIAVAGLKGMAHLSITCEPLSTGHAGDGSGRLRISWRIDSVRRKYGWGEENVYLYNFSDRGVKIFAPGAIDLRS